MILLIMIFKSVPCRCVLLDIVAVSLEKVIFYDKYFRFKNLQTKLGKTSPNSMIPKNQGKVGYS